MEEKQWYIIYTGNPKKVPAVRTAFENVSIPHELWVPSQEVTTTIKGKQVLKMRALFPGYVLAKFSYPGTKIDDELLELKAGYLLHGASESTHPRAVTQEEFEIIDALTHEKIENLTNIPKIAVGSFVEITNGPFINQRGIVVGQKKEDVMVELAFFGRTVSATVPVRSVFVPAPDKALEEMVDDPNLEEKNG
jgi:transcription antitermination factor NusG